MFKHCQALGMFSDGMMRMSCCMEGIWSENMGTIFIIRLVVHFKAVLQRALCMRSAAMPSFSRGNFHVNSLDELALGLGGQGSRVSRCMG